jgi:5-hydroxyisourate hydrolase
VGRLTTHILDTANGLPAANVAIRLYAVDGGRELVTATVSNDDGRTDAPLLDYDAMRAGSYELEFDVGEYFSVHNGIDPKTAFLHTVVIRFKLNADEHYHVPLLASPWSYSTYRGS